MASSLQYKVVELSTVDEGAIERTLNEWVGQGWIFESVQFAMRESSKRPAMAFVFFTRQAEAAAPDPEAARKHLSRLAEEPAEPQGKSAYARLVELAEGPDDEDAPT